MTTVRNSTCYLYDYGLAQNGSDVNIRIPPYKVMMCIACGFITLIGTVGNVMVIVVICRRKNMWKTLNIALLNLAFCDLLFVTICVPIFAYNYAAGDWLLGEFFCKLYNYVMHVTVYMTIYTLVLVSILRYLTIVHSIVTARYRTERNITISLAFLWAAIVISNCPVILIYSMQNVPNNTELKCYKCRVSKDAAKPLYLSFLVLCYFIPLTIIAMFYVAIWRNLKQAQNHMREHSHHVSSGSRHHLKDNTLRATRIIIMVVLIFGVCWLPFQIHILIFYLEVEPKSDAYAVFGITAHFLAFSNSCLNPVIYNYTSTEFREEFRRLCRLPSRRAHIAALDTPVVDDVESASNKLSSRL